MLCNIAPGRLTWGFNRYSHNNNNNNNNNNNHNNNTNHDHNAEQNASSSSHSLDEQNMFTFIICWEPLAPAKIQEVTLMRPFHGNL